MYPEVQSDALAWQDREFKASLSSAFQERTEEKHPALGIDSFQLNAEFDAIQ